MCNAEPTNLVATDWDEESSSNEVYPPQPFRSPTPNYQILTQLSVFMVQCRRRMHAQVLEAALKAVALDDNLADAHIRLCAVKILYLRDWVGARQGTSEQLFDYIHR